MTMAKFLAVFTGEPRSGPPPQMDPKAMAAGLAAWQKWMETHAASIVESGGPLGKTQKISRAGVQEVRNHLAGYVILDAPDQEAAVRMFEGHPHFTIFPGEGVEVMPVLPVPGA
jgi:hypothetical protein